MRSTGKNRGQFERQFNHPVAYAVTQFVPITHEYSGMSMRSLLLIFGTAVTVMALGYGAYALGYLQFSGVVSDGLPRTIQALPAEGEAKS